MMMDSRPDLKRGIGLFDAGRYYEAHEEFEHAWRAAPRAERLFVQALVHCAAACHHAARGNFPGACLQAQRAARKLAGYFPVHGGVDTLRLWRDVQAWQASWRGGQPAGRATIGVRR
jgi:hypothetical protein